MGMGHGPLEIRNRTVKATEILAAHEALGQRSRSSIDRLKTVRERLKEHRLLGKTDLTLYCAGSLARREIGEKSDLDIFMISSDQRSSISRLGEFELFGALIEFNRTLRFEEFSNDGRYLRIYPLDEMTKKTGTPFDDSENLFTARMLLMLESDYLNNEEAYRKCIDQIAKNYFRDKRGKKGFRPLFLLNDVLRYWRTLCLNYEERRVDPSKAWRKKNVNLKFARKLTVFGTVLPVIAGSIDTPDKLVQITSMSPIQRFAQGISFINDDRLTSEFGQFLDVYEEFLRWKELDNPEEFLEGGSEKVRVRENDQFFSDYIFRSLTHAAVPEEYRRFLVI